MIGTSVYKMSRVARSSMPTLFGLVAQCEECVTSPQNAFLEVKVAV